VNATPVVRGGYRVGVPQPGFYEEILNTDAETYGGSNAGNYGGVQAHADWSWQNQPHSIEINLPPLSVIGFKLRN
jgi:1,4-alpha-glucan branching enzyme